MAKMTFVDGHGKEVTREVHETLDIRKFQGMPGYALLVIAANPHLSCFNIWRWLRANGVGRTQSWIARRRWLFQDPSPPGAKRDPDGQNNRAFTIMTANPRLSVRDLTKLLAERGISRSREWVRQNRVVATTNHS
jgi:hypothetical protein